MNLHTHSPGRPSAATAVLLTLLAMLTLFCCGTDETPTADSDASGYPDTSDSDPRSAPAPDDSENGPVSPGVAAGTDIGGFTGSPSTAADGSSIGADGADTGRANADGADTGNTNTDGADTDGADTDKSDINSTSGDSQNSRDEEADSGGEPSNLDTGVQTGGGHHDSLDEPTRFDADLADAEQTITVEVAGDEQTITVEVAGDKVTGSLRRVEVSLGSIVALKVSTTGADDDVHVHGYDILRSAKAGRPAHFAFTAEIPGVFEVELENSGQLLLLLEIS